MSFKLLIAFAWLLIATRAVAQVPAPLPTSPTPAGRGFYQFLNDDTTRRNLSPFYADKPGVLARQGMVASAHPVASQVGVEIMRKGGSAIDAAIAVQFALAVVHPAAGNLGGGGFLVYRTRKGQAYTLDFREKAPEKATRDMYLDSAGTVISNLSMDGHLAAGVPGSVAGMAETHRRFGKLAWQELLTPAIELAEKGVELTEKEATALNRVRSEFVRLNPDNHYLVKDGEWATGERLTQPDLARTLRRIRDHKRAGFYGGETARLIVAEMQRGGGLITQADLDNYRATWREPLVATYKNCRVIAMPPPSSGGVALIQLLRMVQPYPLARWGWNTDSTAAVMIEAERRAYADRARYLGDPDFVKVPVTTLTSPAYLSGRMRDFSFARATASADLGAGQVLGYESAETTHFSVVDKEGNAVAVTTTLNNGFGNRTFVTGAGFLLNNEMDDFSVKPGVPNMYGLVGGEANAIRPQKRMLSSMTPTIVERGGKLLMVVGTPGGSTIITSVFQTILNVLEHGMTMQQAVNALKFHHQWLPDQTVYEQNAFTPGVVQRLQSRGQRLEAQKYTIGRMDCIRRLPDGTLEGASDPRGDDTSVGW